MENLSNLLRGSGSENELSIPCGNFSRQYACMCDYYGLPYREEVAWVSKKKDENKLSLLHNILISQFCIYLGCRHDIHVPQLERVESSRFWPLRSKVSSPVSVKLDGALIIYLFFKSFRDLIPIIAALELNSFFLQFRCSSLKLSHECSERLLAVLKKSATLEEIYVDNAGFKGYLSATRALFSNI